MKMFWHLLPAFGAVLLTASVVHAAADEYPGFLRASDYSGGSACLPQGNAEQALLEQVEESLAVAEVDPDFAIVFTQAVLTCPDIFYVEVENDIRGIGYQYAGQELFDQRPDTRLSGIAFLNDLPYWLEDPEELQTAFLHELGHRWLARVRAEVDGESLPLTGRQGGHWSYFLETGGSPLEGNVFLDTPVPVVETPLFAKAYSELDLYLMGAIPAEQVSPFRLLEPDLAASVTDCEGRLVNASSPPQTCGALELAGTFVELTLADVVASEGPRVPDAAESQKEFSVVFLLFDSQMALNRKTCLALEGLSSDLVDLFSRATGGHLRLVNLVPGGHTCESLPTEDQKAVGGCSLVGVGSASWPRLALWLPLLLVFRRRRRFSRSRPG